MDKLIQVTNRQGRAFNVRAVFDGDRYGMDDVLVHTGAPMVEFYDATQDPALFGSRGQFVARYYAKTLAERPVLRGDLPLDCGIPEWKVSEDNVQRALTLVLAEVTLRKEQGK